MIKQKKGMEMTIATVIAILIGLFLLVAVLLSFTSTEGKFRDVVSGFFSSSNVDQVVNQCNRNVDLNEQYEYCCTDKTIKLSSKEEVIMPCMNASVETWGSRINELNCEAIC